MWTNLIKIKNKLNLLSIEDALNTATEHFVLHYIDSPRLTAELLLAYSLNQYREYLYSHFHDLIDETARNRFESLVNRRIQREPVAYILGHKEFWSKDFNVTPSVLIPRPETEFLVQSSCNILISHRRPLRIVELGTGSGAVILSLLSEYPDHFYCASDISSAALQVAVSNAVKLGVLGQIQFVQSDWFSAFSPKNARFDLIISNPPYIPTNDILSLSPEIFQYEPYSALDGGMNGLECIIHIIRHAHMYLQDKGYLVIEIGWNQDKDVFNAVQSIGIYDHLCFISDYGGTPRVAHIQKK
ncbi:MAG: peptide chain release factor N(5)-glutamine methyltransferase [Desulfobacterales bacterium]|nr:peptide chain release factor N(5)-glutamine methyltransferase [Desulfobacterales bacterium]